SKSLFNAAKPSPSSSTSARSSRWERGEGREEGGWKMEDGAGQHVPVFRPLRSIFDPPSSILTVTHFPFFVGANTASFAGFTSSPARATVTGIVSLSFLGGRQRVSLHAW